VSDSRSVDYLFSTGGPVCKSIQFHISDICSDNQLHYTGVWLQHRARRLMNCTLLRIKKKRAMQLRN